MAVTVQVRDGHVTYDEGAAIDIVGEGDDVGALVILDDRRREVARFGVGNWLDAGVDP